MKTRSKVIILTCLGTFALVAITALWSRLQQPRQVSGNIAAAPVAGQKPAPVADIAKAPSLATPQQPPSTRPAPPPSVAQAAVPGTSVPLSEPAHKSRPKTLSDAGPEPPGVRAIATVTVDGAKTTLHANYLGNYPRIYIDPHQKVPVSINFPDAQPDEPVSVHVEDGGVLDNSAPGKAAKLDDERNIAFQFQASADPGIYHVAVRKGADQRVLNFWAGPPPPVTNR